MTRFLHADQNQSTVKQTLHPSIQNAQNVIDTSLRASAARGRRHHLTVK